MGKSIKSMCSDCETHFFLFPRRLWQCLTAESDSTSKTVYIARWKALETPSLVQTSIVSKKVLSLIRSWGYICVRLSICLSRQRHLKGQYNPLICVFLRKTTKYISPVKTECIGRPVSSLQCPLVDQDNLMPLDHDSS